MMISPGVLSFFNIFIFWAVRGVKGQKMAQDDKNILSVALHISETIYLMIVIYGHGIIQTKMEVGIQFSVPNLALSPKYD